MSNELVCPKCGSLMRSYERNQVTVDQCTGCGGLFLDRGELEALAQAESAFYGGGQPQQAQPQPTPAAPQPPQQYEERRDSRDDRDHRGDGGYKKKKKSKKSFLEDLFEMGG